MTINDVTLTSDVTGKTADFVIRNTNQPKTCQSGTRIEGNLVIQNGSIELNACVVLGNLSVSGYAAVNSGNAEVKGNVSGVGQRVALPEQVLGPGRRRREGRRQHRRQRADVPGRHRDRQRRRRRPAEPAQQDDDHTERPHQRQRDDGRQHRQLELSRRAVGKKKALRIPSNLLCAAPPAFEVVKGIIACLNLRHADYHLFCRCLIGTTRTMFFAFV